MTSGWRLKQEKLMSFLGRMGVTQTELAFFSHNEFQTRCRCSHVIASDFVDNRYVLKYGWQYETFHSTKMWSHTVNNNVENRILSSLPKLLLLLNSMLKTVWVLESDKNRFGASHRFVTSFSSFFLSDMGNDFHSNTQRLVSCCLPFCLVMIMLDHTQGMMSEALTAGQGKANLSWRWLCSVPLTFLLLTVKKTVESTQQQIQTWCHVTSQNREQHTLSLKPELIDKNVQNQYWQVIVPLTYPDLKLVPNFWNPWKIKSRTIYAAWTRHILAQLFLSIRSSTKQCYWLIIFSFAATDGMSCSTEWIKQLPASKLITDASSIRVCRRRARFHCS